MTQLEYRFFKGEDTEPLFGKYRYDEVVAQFERFHLTDVQRVESFLKGEFPNERIFVSKVFNKKIVF